MLSPSVLLILLVFMASGVLFVVTSFSADFCADPSGNILDLADLNNQPIALYFV